MGCSLSSLSMYRAVTREILENPIHRVAMTAWLIMKKFNLLASCFSGNTLWEENWTMRCMQQAEHKQEERQRSGIATYSQCNIEAHSQHGNCRQSGCQSWCSQDYCLILFLTYRHCNTCSTDLNTMCVRPKKTPSIYP